MTGPRKGTMPVVHAFCPSCRKTMSEIMIGGAGGLEEAEKRARARVCQHMSAKHPRDSALTRPGWEVMYWSLEVREDWMEYAAAGSEEPSPQSQAWPRASQAGPEPAGLSGGPPPPSPGVVHNPSPFAPSHLIPPPPARSPPPASLCDTAASAQPRQPQPQQDRSQVAGQAQMPPVSREGRPTHSRESRRPLPAMSSRSSSSSWSGPRERRCRGPVHMRRRAPSAPARSLPRAAQSPTPEARQTTDAATGGLRLDAVIGVLLRARVQNLPHLLAPLLGSLPTDQLRTTVGLVVEELRRREASSPGQS